MLEWTFSGWEPFLRWMSMIPEPSEPDAVKKDWIKYNLIFLV